MGRETVAFGHCKEGGWTCLLNMSLSHIISYFAY